MVKKKDKDVDIHIKVDNIEKAIKSGMKHNKKKHCHSCHTGGCGYFLGFLGAVVYYVSTAGTFWAGVLGFLKAIVWPAFLVFELLKFVGA